ncbi:hypothetical protein E2C01_006283 [Portunus trituberculatus]|uniref:Uncharacterized protein n=1 Tax=Portunus trituberculatus TaxID=210409 RepID=A0A5B7CWQ6_PORTR|nr:hypothetical protein [Portunus trituberculatus]
MWKPPHSKRQSGKQTRASHNSRQRIPPHTLHTTTRPHPPRKSEIKWIDR